MNDNDLLNLIEKEIDIRHKADGNNFHVQRNGVRHEGNWRFVILLPEPADMRAYKYTEFLDEVEEAVEKQANVKLLLVPALPD